MHPWAKTVHAALSAPGVGSAEQAVPSAVKFVAPRSPSRVDTIL